MSVNNYDEDASILLSKNITRTLLVKNAISQETFKKQSRLLEKEKNSEERLFLKKKEHLLQRQAFRNSGTLMSQRTLSSTSLIPPETTVTRWKSDTNLDRELSPASPRPRRQDVDDNNGRQNLLSSWLPLLSEGADKKSRPHKSLPSLSQYSDTATSLPDIQGALGRKKIKKYSDSKRPRPLSNHNKEKTGVESSVVDDWKELRKIRYLRRLSTKQDPR